MLLHAQNRKSSNLYTVPFSGKTLLPHPQYHNNVFVAGQNVLRIIMNIVHSIQYENITSLADGIKLSLTF